MNFLYYYCYINTSQIMLNYEILKLCLKSIFFL